jgi:hypothetical protein
MYLQLETQQVPELFQRIFQGFADRLAPGWLQALAGPRVLKRDRKNVQVSVRYAAAPLSNRLSRLPCCSKAFHRIGFTKPLRPGGGMAYAGDLKSPVPNGTCGFDSHPGHSIQMGKWASADARKLVDHLL